MTLKPGIYRLDEPVANPEPARRYRGNLNAIPVFPIGYYEVKHESRYGDAIVTVGRADMYGPLYEGQLGFEALVIHLVEAEESFDSLLTELRGDVEHNAVEMLRFLVAKGKLSLRDVRDAFKWIH
jgi:hypothetical protein